MAVSFAGAISISSNTKYQYTKWQKLINFMVALAPNILSQFKQEPKTIKTETFERDGVALSPTEILETKASMVNDALRQFDAQFASIEETRTGPLKMVTMSYGINGITQTDGEEFDPFEKKMKEIESISKDTINTLSNNGVNFKKLKERIINDREPLKMAFRVKKILWILDNFEMPNNLQNTLCDKLKTYVAHNAIAEQPSYDDASHAKHNINNTCCAPFSKCCTTENRDSWPTTKPTVRRGKSLKF